jgi:hypothetical protein
MNTEFAPLFKLGRAERLQLVEDLEGVQISPVAAFSAFHF